MVLIHDGVRPLVPVHVLERAVEAAVPMMAGSWRYLPRTPSRLVTDGVVSGTPARENLWLAQTPQAFRYEVILAAHEIAEAEGFVGTDDAMLVERLEKKVHVVIGDYRNIKITTPEDLVLAEAFMRERAFSAISSLTRDSLCGVLFSTPPRNPRSP